MKAVLFVIACLIAAAVAAPLSDSQYQFLFSKFVEQYNKQYEINDFFTKFNTFKSNLDLIVAHNAQNLSYKMGVNQFTDYTQAEFNQMMGLRTELAQPYALSQLEHKIAPISTNGDWKTTNWSSKMTPVKNQASCGSCWAFSAIASVEFENTLKTGQIVDLSEQQLVDCSGSTGNSGCNGGLMSNAFEYLKTAGSCKQTDYPGGYTAKDGKCQQCSASVRVTGYNTVPTTEDAHYTLVQDRVVSVALAASSSAFQFYKTGVVENCTDRSINHGVTLVGSGNENGKNYFLIRNSWGTSWGDNGFIKLGQGNQCGLTTSRFDVTAKL